MSGYEQQAESGYLAAYQAQAYGREPPVKQYAIHLILCVISANSICRRMVFSTPSYLASSRICESILRH